MSDTVIQPKPPEGYKQTEVGVIPEDWDVKTIDEVAFVTSGKRLPLGSSLVEAPTPYPYIRVTDMRPGTVNLSAIRYVPESVFPTIRRYRIYQADIFISVAGSLGIVGKIPAELDGANLTENADRITNITCSQNYLLHLLLSPLIQNTIDSIRTVGAQPKLALTRIRKFAIPLPPTEAEQRAIAEVLSDVDGLIGALDKLIAKKRAIKQAAMQQLLTGKIRLPGFREKWEKKKIGEVFSIRIGTSKSQYVVDGGAYLVVDMGSISRDGQLIASKATDYHGDFVERGDLIMPKDDIGGGNIIGKVAYIDANERYILGDHVYALRSSQGNPLFLTYLINGHETNIALKSKVTGSAQLGLARKAVEEQEIPFPATEEQDAIATVLSDMDAEIEALERRRDKTKQIKQGMMQQLLTGRIRLVHTEVN